jgi:hypothetical protein
MSAKTVATTTGSIGAELLEKLIELDPREISPPTARKFLSLAFTDVEQEAVSALMAKARAGTLTAAEGFELDEFLHIADLLAILQSRARQALKHSEVTN